MAITVLKQLGLNDKEERTFLMLLELGAQPVSKLANQVGIPRSTMYLVLERLKEHGLIEEYDFKSKKYVRCIDVKELMHVIENRERQLTQTKILLEESLPELERLQNKQGRIPTSVQFIEGREAVIKFYQNLESLLWNKDYYAIYNASTIQQVVPEIFNPRKYKGDTAMCKELLLDTPEAHKYYETFRKVANNHIKFLPKDFSFISDITMTDTTIYTITIDENHTSAMIINNADLASLMRQMFDLQWALLPYPDESPYQRIEHEKK